MPLTARLPFVAAVLVAAVASHAAAQTGRAPALAIPRVTIAPTLADVIAGRMPAAGRIMDFRQRAPGDGVPSTQATTAYLAHDATHVYVGFHCREDPGLLRAHMAKREDIADDDQVAVYVDTFRDRQRAYVFAANPLGIQRDSIHSETEDPDDSFDTVWQADGQLTSDGFAVLIAIPFSSLRFAGSGPQTWGLALGRSEPRDSEEVFWPYITSRIEGFTNQLAEVALEGVPPGRNVQVLPYGVFGGARTVNEDSGEVARTTDPRAGLDVKVVLGSAFTLDTTVNPDFSEVESDEPQVTVTRRFETFFPEKRPLFIENADFFATPDDLFYSRRVGDPQVAARLTGKAGGWTIGALAGDDRAVDPEPDTASTGRTGLGVLRVQRSLGEQSRVGAFASARSGPAGDNEVIAADARLKMSPTWVFTGMAARSASRAPDGSRASGGDYYGEVARSGRGFNYSGSYLDRSPDFDAQLGFIERVDLRETEHAVSYAWHPTRRPLLAIEPVFTGSVGWNHAGRRQDWSAQPGLNISLAGPVDVQVWRTEYHEVIEGIGLREHDSGIAVTDGRLGWLLIGGGYSSGAQVNYHPPEGAAPFLTGEHSANLSLTWRPARRLRISETYAFTRQSVPAASPGGAPASGRVLDNHVARLKASYQFTRRLSVRAIADYNAVRSNPLLTDQPFSQQLTSDLLLTYLVDPFTAIHAGYNDQPGSRQAFVKIGFLLRF